MFNKISLDLFKGHGYTGVNWTMSMAERFALVGILQHTRPPLAIEIGSLEGGSLGILSHYSDRVISIDPDPEVRSKLESVHANVAFVTEPSQTALPRILKEIRNAGEPLGFVLVDGDHTEEGVAQDLEMLLTYTPVSPLWILMHDSFNPDCRKGIKKADWADNPHVQWVDFDFVPGFLNSVPGWEDQMWCGFAAAYLTPEPRSGPLPFDELLGRQFEKLLPLSKHQ